MQKGTFIDFTPLQFACQKYNKQIISNQQHVIIFPEHRNRNILPLKILLRIIVHKTDILLKKNPIP